MKYYVCAIIKDEHRYLDEWLEHCLNLGFNEIHLFEDFGSKSHSEITNEYSQVYLHNISDVPHTDYKGNDKKQVDMALFFISKYKNGWCAFIDPDEYITFEKNYTLEKLCSEFSGYRGIYLMYKIYDANGNIERPIGGVVDSYGNSTSMPYHKWKTNHKSLVNLSYEDISFSSVHHVRCGVYTDFHQRRHNSYEHPEKDLCYKKAWIDHYYTKSWEDWKERFTKRGDVVDGNVSICDFFIYNTKMYSVLTKQKTPIKVDLKGRMGNQLFIISAVLNKYSDVILLFIGKELDHNVKRILNRNSIWWKKWEGEEYIEYFDDYFQDASLHDELILQNRIKLSSPRDTFDFVIHIRREDYLKYQDKYYILTKEYIERMYNKYYKGGTVAIVSTLDGIEWAKEQNFTFNFECVSETPIECLSVIANAKTIICSGSSFSIMGCMLNNNKNKVCVIHKPYDKISTGHDCIIPNYFKIEKL